MTGFEPRRTSGIGSNHSDNWAANTANFYVPILFTKRFRYLKLNKHFVIPQAEWRHSWDQD